MHFTFVFLFVFKSSHRSIRKCSRPNGSDNLQFPGRQEEEPRILLPRVRITQSGFASEATTRNRKDKGEFVRGRVDSNVASLANFFSFLSISGVGM